MSVTDQVIAMADRILETVSGEPLRLISYASGAIIYVAARVLGQIDDVSFADAVVQATSAAAILVTVTEAARRYVRPA